MELAIQALGTTEQKPKFKLFVRWNHSHDDAGGTVELAKDGNTIWSRPCGNNDRVYGYCMALVDILRAMEHNITMPNCLQRHICPDRTRED